MVTEQMVPGELRQHPHWVSWRYERRGAKRTKVPYDPRSGRRASTTDPATWTTFIDATRALTGGRFDGIGFVFSEADPFAGVDLDDCIKEDGHLTDAAQAIVTRLNTYTEISPSGQGVKLFLQAEMPSGRRRKGNIEMYDQARFFTVTGRHLPGTPLTVEARQADLEALHREVLQEEEEPQPKPRRVARGRTDGDDRQLLAKARSAKNGRKFMRLFYCGDVSAYGRDDSAADLALCALLAYWCGPDPERIDRLFRESALMRDKWDSRRRDTTYGAITVATSLGA